jgi:hypothetical protein
MPKLQTPLKRAESLCIGGGKAFEYRVSSVYSTQRIVHPQPTSRGLRQGAGVMKIAFGLLCCTSFQQVKLSD